MALMMNAWLDKLRAAWQPLARPSMAPPPPHQDPSVQEAGFVDGCFRVMGFLAKVDGPVQEQEIQYARALMLQMQLGPKATQAAMISFNQGKTQTWTSLVRMLQDLRRRYRGRVWVGRLFLELQMRAACSDASLNPKELDTLKALASLLDVGGLQFAIIKARVERTQVASPRAHAPLSVTQAYVQLGLQPGASPEAVRLAFKRQMSRYHPDRAQTPEQRQIMELRARQINQAYQLLKKHVPKA